MKQTKLWWSGEPTERFWLEVTDRRDLGSDLQAPEVDATGRPNPRYYLFKQAQVGDVVYHYYKPESAIVAFSVIAGRPAARTVTWGARGTSARSKNVKPHERPGYSIPLTRFTKLITPLTLSSIRAQKDALKLLSDELKKRHAPAPLHFPFELLTREPRPMQGYAFKLPRDFVLAFPELQLSLDALPQVQPSFQSDDPELHEPKPDELRRSGQGRTADVDLRNAIELAAMNAASDYFRSRGYKVEDVHHVESFDLLASKGLETLHVEVKGTTGSGDSVFLTRNEVDLVRSHPRRAVLFVLSGISISRTTTGVSATGGISRVLQPWSIADDALDALQYRYTLPLS